MATVTVSNSPWTTCSVGVVRVIVTNAVCPPRVGVAVGTKVQLGAAGATLVRIVAGQGERVAVAVGVTEGVGVNKGPAGAVSGLGDDWL